MTAGPLSDLFVTVGTGRFPEVWLGLRLGDGRLAAI